MAREKHYAEVSRNKDLQSLLGGSLRGAVFISSDTLTGGQEWPTAVQPRFPCRGMFWVPEVEEQLEIDLSDPEHPDERILGFVYSAGDAPHELFQENYPQRRGWVSPSEHHLVFDDSELGSAVLFFHSSGTGHEWDFDGNELKTIVGDLIEEIQGNVERTLSGDFDEIIDGDVSQEWGGDWIFEVGGDVRWNLNGAWRLDLSGAWTQKAESVELEGGAGEKLVLKGGKAGLGVPGVEVFDSLSKAIDEQSKAYDAFIQNAATIVSTSVGPGILHPGVVTILTASKGVLDALKSAIDAMKASL